MSDTFQENHRKGLMITALGGLVLTVDIPLIKLAEGELWSVLMIRSGCTFAVALILWGVLGLRGRPVPLIQGKTGLVVSLCYGFSAISFIAAVFNTTTANLVFILAFNPMFAALLAWVLFNQAIKPVTVITIVAMIIGVFIIVGDGIGTGNWFGDLMAITSAFLIACAITITRASGRDMGFAAIIATIVPFSLACYMVYRNGYSIDVPGWVLLNGIVVMPISFFCLAIGPKFITGPEVAMFYLLETVLTPIWVWMIFNEVPSRQSLIGGSILIIALLFHSVWQLMSIRRRKAPVALRHPP